MTIGRRFGSTTFVALAALVACALAAGPAPAAERAALGKVVAVNGDAWLESPDGARRALECGDTVMEGDRLVTGPGARVGVQAKDVFAQIEGGSEVSVTRGPDGAPKLAVVKGDAKVRRMDLANLRKAGTVARPGDCAPARPSPVALGPGDLDQVIGGPANRFSPTDVAAGPPAIGGPGPEGPSIVDPCVLAPCIGSPTPVPRSAPPTPITPVEQPPGPSLPPLGVID